VLEERSQRTTSILLKQLNHPLNWWSLRLQWHLFSFIRLFWRTLKKFVNFYKSNLMNRWFSYSISCFFSVTIHSFSIINLSLYCSLILWSMLKLCIGWLRFCSAVRK
jgi:hypothetical protein